MGLVPPVVLQDEEDEPPPNGFKGIAWVESDVVRHDVFFMRIEDHFTPSEQTRSATEGLTFGVDLCRTAPYNRDMNRTAAIKAVIESYRTRPHFNRIMEKLTTSDMSEIIAFVDDNGDLDRGSMEVKINRLYLDLPNKPKNWTRIQEILSCANSAV